ncbi:hypothetical protein EY643_06610 [Halioglobus maricola]|uniref:Uncharacterized protein n=1 Tax=Halioglobus maricola TaxID=2601894 RepID=A0A5P9NK46_9GAMM|nr:hypothetical protein [Halioglobus maricola]QFU75348.1 hypothetical protein EY643_06610 [Halioglobus maricola]
MIEPLIERFLWKNERWTGPLRNQGYLEEDEILRSFIADQNRMITSPRLRQEVTEITSAYSWRADLRRGTEKAIHSLINACFEAYHSRRDNSPIGVLWKTGTDATPKNRYFNGRLFPEARRRDAADVLQEHGYIEFYRGGKSGSAGIGGLTSLAVPTEKIRHLYNEVILEASYSFEGSVDPTGSEVVILQGRNDRLQDYADNPRTIWMRKNINGLRAVNASVDWVHPDNAGRPVVSNLRSLALTRKFKQGSFRCYGRFHCGLQNLSKEDRKAMTIGGEPVAELDFRAMMPTLAYAETGLQSSAHTPLQIDGDAYNIPGFEREHVKVAFQVMLNSKSPQGAVQAIVKKEGMGLFKEARELRDAIATKHWRISHMFYDNTWESLYFRESEIMMSVIAFCVEHSIPLLPIHDGAVCRDRDWEKVHHAMETAFRQSYDLSPHIHVKRRKLQLAA